jgi:hypothetical protein
MEENTEEGICAIIRRIEKVEGKEDGRWRTS